MLANRVLISLLLAIATSLALAATTSAESINIYGDPGTIGTEGAPGNPGATGGAGGDGSAEWQPRGTDRATAYRTTPATKWAPRASGTSGSKSSSTVATP